LISRDSCPSSKPLRLLLDAIKPAHVSGFIFPNIIGGALDLDNLFDRVMRPTVKADNLMWKAGRHIVAVPPRTSKSLEYALPTVVCTFQIAVRFWTVPAGIGRLGSRSELLSTTKI